MSQVIEMEDELKRLQRFQLEKFKKFRDVCDENGIKFFIIGGTLLGAVRHKGYIPWDDDIDIAMPREDYNALIKLARKKNLFDDMKVENYKLNGKMRCYFSRLIVNEDVRKKEGFKANSELGLVIVDILPLDGTPDNKYMRKLYYFRALFYRTLSALSNLDVKNIDKNRKGLEKKILVIGQKLKLYKLINRTKCYNKLDKLYSKNSWKKSKMSGTITGAYKTREIVPTEYFGRGRMYPFEDTEFLGPELYDKYLTHMYGDYMKLPPESERKSHFTVEFKE